MTETLPRLVALDVLRGTAVAGMILVTSPGDWSATYAPLQHAAWDGWTLADMVFPTFLFSVGVAQGFSFPKSLANKDERLRFWWRVSRRVFTLTLLGLFLEATYNWSIDLAGANAGGPGNGGLENLRIPGILQRIAFCYTLAVVIIMATAGRDAERRTTINVGAIAVAAALLLLAYWAVMTLIPVPGFGAGRLDPEGNLAAYIDRAIFTTPHLWSLGWVKWGGPIVYDPEGLLSGVPATANTLVGVIAATIWRRAPARAIAIVAFAGVGLFLAGFLLNPLFVINKRVWTSSFALLSTGFSAVLLAALAFALRNRAVMHLAAPLRILGGNAILAFIVATLLGRVYGFPFGRADGTLSPQAWANSVTLSAVRDARLTSFLCALSMVALVVLTIFPFHRRGIHFRL